MFDGSYASAETSNLNHILSKHGLDWGIYDIDLEATKKLNEKNPESEYDLVRIKTNVKNRNMLRKQLREFAKKQNLEVFENYRVNKNGEKGRAYLCPKTKLHIGLDKNGKILKAYKANRRLVRHLRENCK
jgi:uncharacterized OsmC-like protein